MRLPRWAWPRMHQEAPGRPGHESLGQGSDRRAAERLCSHLDRTGVGGWGGGWDSCPWRSADSGASTKPPSDPCQPGFILGIRDQRGIWTLQTGKWILRIGGDLHPDGDQDQDGRARRRRPLSSARVARGVKFYCSITVRRAMLISMASCSGGFRGGHDSLLELRSVFPRLVTHFKGK